MSTPQRSVSEKATDLLTAFNIIRDEITPPEFRAVIHNVTQVPPATEEEGVEGFNRYVNALNASLGVSRVVMANDRAALLAAAMITQSGVSRPVISTDEEG